MRRSPLVGGVIVRGHLAMRMVGCQARRPALRQGKRCGAETTPGHREHPHARCRITYPYRNTLLHLMGIFQPLVYFVINCWNRWKARRRAKPIFHPRSVWVNFSRTVFLGLGRFAARATQAHWAIHSKARKDFADVPRARGVPGMRAWERRSPVATVLRIRVFY